MKNFTDVQRRFTDVQRLNYKCYDYLYDDVEKREIPRMKLLKYFEMLSEKGFQPMDEF